MKVKHKCLTIMQLHIPDAQRPRLQNLAFPLVIIAHVLRQQQFPHPQIDRDHQIHIMNSFLSVAVERSDLNSIQQMPTHFVKNVQSIFLASPLYKMTSCLT